MFNTLRYANMLEEVGFSREQAETSVKILVEIMEDKLASKQDLRELALTSKQYMHEHTLATKQDMREHALATKHALQELEVKMENRFTQMDSKLALLESRLTIKMGTMLAASIAVLTAIQKLT